MSTRCAPFELSICDSPFHRSRPTLSLSLSQNSQRHVLQNRDPVERTLFASLRSRRGLLRRGRLLLSGSLLLGGLTGFGTALLRLESLFPALEQQIVQTFACAPLSRRRVARRLDGRIRFSCKGYCSCVFCRTPYDRTLLKLFKKNRIVGFQAIYVYPQDSQVSLSLLKESRLFGFISSASVCRWDADSDLAVSALLL